MYRVSINVEGIVACGLIFSLYWAGSPRPERAVLARFARLTLVGKSSGHQLASLADLPTIVS